MIAKAMLPGFGGSYLVWGTCMAFFQGVLLLGYIYAHAVQTRFGVVRYSRWHALPLLAAIPFIPFPLIAVSGTVQEGPLFLGVLLVLLVTVSVPFFTLSTGSVILQSWLSRSDLPERENPYVLYSASNLGSLSALLTYPIAFEPTLDLQTQAWIWVGLYAIMAVLFAFCLPPRRNRVYDRPEGASVLARVPFRDQAGWFFLSASASALLIAATNVITLDIASVPFLWILPLSVYLLTFVLVFKRRPWIPRWLWPGFYYAALAGTVLFLMAMLRWTLPVAVSLSLHLGVLFIVCMACHGTMAQRRPKDVRHLTGFYVVLSFGGFCGSLTAAGLIPLISTSIVEYPMALGAAALALAFAMERREESDGAPVSRRRLPSLGTGIAGVATVLCLTALPWMLFRLGFEARMTAAAVLLPLSVLIVTAKMRPFRLAIMLVAIIFLANTTELIISGGRGFHRHRNYYGIYRIYEQTHEYETGPAIIRYLQHGTTDHGRQYLSGGPQDTPLSYYHPSAPMGEVLTSRHFTFNDIAAVGLGTGSIAAYASEGDRIVFYELDPDNLAIAEEYFTYLRQGRAQGAEIDFIFGDGRVRLREAPDASFDLLVLDAFSSGSIPVHLLTVEAVEEFLRVLRPDGVLLFHISNRLMELEPLAFSVAEAAGGLPALKTNAGNVHRDADYTSWMAVTNNPEVHEQLIRMGWRREPFDGKRVTPWTDRYSNLLQVLM